MNWSYVAGYFDGEGCVSLCLCANGRMMYGLTWHNTHLESLQAIVEFMGAGKVRLKKRQPNQNHQVYYIGVHRRRELLHCLDNMIPLLIVKRPAAERLREFLLANVKDESPNFGKVAAITDEQLKQWYFDEGQSYSQIAKRLGVCHAAIAQAFRVRGIKARPSGYSMMKGIPKSDETKRRMKEAWVRRRQLLADIQKSVAELN